MHVTCTVTCHMHVMLYVQTPGVPEGNGDDLVNPDHSLTPSKAPCPPGWNGAEVTYFTMLHPLFGHNYCSLAELIGTKTCYQVYQYAQLASGDALPGQGAGPGGVAGKKKKRNMR